MIIDEHVVYMGERLESDYPHKALHLTMMKDVVGSITTHIKFEITVDSEATKHLFYSYEKSFNGFFANLTDEEVEKLTGMERVISVFPNEKLELATTKSWDFMGFPIDVSRNVVESEVIVGVIDSGIWPESPSFNDENMGPPPLRWKGICQNSTTNFTCNRKIIGGRYFRTDGLIPEIDVASPRDTEGHGTHVSSIIAGSTVSSASFSGLGNGTARGGVPSARIAVYKVCWSDGCYLSDILAGFDAAIADGVDILSVSLGFRSGARPYSRDPVAIGSFHAMRKGILTSASAGNGGPARETVGNVAPWLLSGLSLNTINLQNKTFPMIYGGTAQNFSESSSSRYCSEDTLNSTIVKDKIVLCDFWSRGLGPFKAGAIGAIMNENETLDYTLSSPIPTSFVGIEAGINIFSYIVTSTRGPNTNSPSILKPDLTAPGVEILAAWSPISPPSGIEGDNRTVEFNIISGTSMSCPHATAAVAYVKSFHPTWSPSAIKSALMTTAFPLNTSLTKDAEFAYGSGHINPLKAIDPGLVYDLEEADYINLLCAEGLNSTLVRLISGDNTTACSQPANGISNVDLNYPSMALNVSIFTSSFNGTFKRTVTHVGSAPKSVYKALIKAPIGLNITVVPTTLSFTSIGEKASFSVLINGTFTGDEDMVSTSLVWDDGVHQVKSPIVVFSYFSFFF
ncbi:hypothetical protein V2J09_017537 [Rumex salicifolius]